MKFKKYLWLCIVPVIVIVFNYFFVKNQGKFFMNWTDPTYAYLFNGMNLADGHMEIGHIDHPGTTIQMAAGVIIKVTHMIAGRNPDLTTDVLTDPERYIHIISFVFILLCAVFVFYLGKIIQRVSGNTALAVFFQAGVIISFITIFCMAEVRTEPFLIIGGLVLTAVMFSFINEQEIGTKRMYGYSLKFAAVLAFLIVSKITSVPLIILPLFMLRGWKSWIVYSIALLAFTALLMFPILSKLGIFFEWIGKLYHHTGLYGLGEERVINPEDYKMHLWYIVRDDIPFDFTTLLMIVTLIVQGIRGKLKPSAWRKDVLTKLLTGLTFATFICVAIVAKHFKGHYLIPACGLMMIGTYVSLRLLFPDGSRLQTTFQNRKLQAGCVALIVALFTLRDACSYNFNPHLEDPRFATTREMEKYKGIPRLYMTDLCYSAEISPAIFFGTCYAGERRFDYYKKLNVLHPEAYFYFTASGLFRHWGSSFDLEDFVTKNKKVLISFPLTDSAIIAQSLGALEKLNERSKLIDIKQVYVNPVTGEQLYEMTTVGQVTLIPDSAKRIICDVEHVVHDSLVSNDGSLHYAGFEGITTKEKHSGNSCIGLSDKNPYGFGVNFDVTPGEHLEISVWRKSSSGLGIIVASGMDGKFNPTSSSVVEQGENGWERLRLRVDIPADFTGQLLAFAFNENEHTPVYFDDFTIIHY
jgi:hypothetical protein